MIKLHKGSTNVYADLGRPDADEMLIKAQLADTLQLMAGALSAGLSLAQGVDTVVREGSDPVASEFRRALMETRLGVDIEDALRGVAERMQSVDFEWVVMAIRIQREVGGNLAEILDNVADTLRERAMIRRQIRVLTAEGRLSAWVLAGLPVAIAIYMFIVNPDYIGLLFTHPIGLFMLGGAIGALLFSRFAYRALCLPAALTGFAGLAYILYRLWSGSRQAKRA